MSAFIFYFISYLRQVLFHILDKFLNFIISYDNVIWAHKNQIFPADILFQSGCCTTQNVHVLYTLRKEEPKSQHNLLINKSHVMAQVLISTWSRSFEFCVFKGSVTITKTSVVKVANIRLLLSSLISRQLALSAY